MAKIAEKRIITKFISVFLCEDGKIDIVVSLLDIRSSIFSSNCEPAGRHVRAHRLPFGSPPGGICGPASTATFLVTMSCFSQNIYGRRKIKMDPLRCRNKYQTRS